MSAHTTTTGRTRRWLAALTAAAAAGALMYSTAAAGPVDEAEASETAMAPTEKLPVAERGQRYEHKLAFDSGKGPFTYSLHGGSLPLGLQLESDGKISGTVDRNAADNNRFTVAVKDEGKPNSDPTIWVQWITVVNSPGLRMSPQELPGVQPGGSYDVTFETSGGTAPYKYFTNRTVDATDSDGLKIGRPPGLRLTTEGRLYGTVDADVSGTYAFNMTSTDKSWRTISQRYTIEVRPEITLSPDRLPAGTVGQPFNQTLTAEGGTEPYKFKVTDGEQPPGLDLDESGELTGTPSKVGRYTFTVQATDDKGFTENAEYTIDVNGYDVQVTPTTLPGGTAYKAYQQKLTSPNGAEPVKFTLDKGPLPSGTALASDGTLSGTPKKAGKYAFTVKATDASGSTGTQSYTIDIAKPTITIGPTALKSAKAGKNYSAQLTAKGGAGPYTFKVVSGKLPSGMALSTKGALSKSTKKTGTYTFTVEVKDANGHTTTKKYTLKVTR